jgi:hypothetical protein
MQVVSDQQVDASEEQGGRPEEAGEAPGGKAGRAVRDHAVDVVATVAGVAALVALLVQHEYQILLITFFICVLFIPVYYIIGYLRKEKNGRLVVAFVALPILTAIVGILLAMTRTKPPSSTPSPNPSVSSTPTSSTPTPAPASTSPAPPSLNSVQVEIQPPNAIHAGQNAELNGTVAGLDQENLWIIEQPSDSPGTLVISGDGPAATHDGRWKLTATQVGDPSDIGLTMKFFAIRADKSCSERLSKIVSDAGENAAKIDPGLYPGCATVGTTVDVPVIA